jgi:hypothetical protein
VLLKDQKLTVFLAPLRKAGARLAATSLFGTARAPAAAALFFRNARRVRVFICGPLLSTVC